MRIVRFLPHNVYRRKLSFLAYAAALLCCINYGCGIIAHAIPDVRKNIVMVNAKGKPVDPTGNFDCNRPQEGQEGWCNGLHSSLSDYEEISEDLYAQHLKEMTNDIAFRIPQTGSIKKVLIFVHGGMNTQAGTIERTARSHGAIEEEGYYPIFINWQSSFLASYKNHLLHIRQGEYWGESPQGSVWGLLTSPFYLIGDIARSIARAPVVIGLMVRSDIQSDPTLRPIYGENYRIAKEIALSRFCDYDRQAHDKEFTKDEDKCPPQISPVPSTIPIWLGDDRRGLADMLVAGGKYILTFPSKLAISPILDAGGTSSWESMLRARSMLFQIERDCKLESDGTIRSDCKTALDDAREAKLMPLCSIPEVRQHGAILQLMQQLRFLKDCKGVKFDITLVGHSMGTIVVNEIIRRFDDLPINRIIYMAAATSIHDYEDSIFPYLQKKKNDPNVKFYHLILHSVSEVREAWDEYTLGIDLPPRGSLLVWIDNFLANPMDPQDRTVGRFVNLMLALHHTPSEIAKKIHVKGFRVGDPSESPLKHSHFTYPFHFWESKCWEPQYDSVVFRECMKPREALKP